MRVAGVAVLALALLGCATPSDPQVPAGSRWSIWTEPVAGVSARAFLPARVVRGDRVPVEFVLRLHPDPAVPERIHLDARNIIDRVSQVLRRPGDGPSISVETDDVDFALDGSSVPDERTGADWPRFADSPSVACRLEIPLARAWEEVDAGSWEACVEFKGRVIGEGAEATSVVVRTEPLPVLVDPAPPRHQLLRPPARLRLDAAEDGFVVVRFDPGSSDVVDLQPRYGFVVMMRVDSTWGSGSASWHTSPSHVLGDDQEVDRLLPVDKGPLDKTYEVDIFEIASDPGMLFWFFEKHEGYRSLWKGTFRVTATAAEVEALRR